jgi:hypothetical protein
VAHSVRTLALLLALAAAAPAASARSPFLPSPPYGPPREIVFFGHISSLKPSGERYVMRFDPAILLTGRTASAYALEKTGSSDVPNDHITYDPEHQLLTFVVPANARATVMTNKRNVGIKATPVSIPLLARVVAGKAPRSLALFEPQAAYWIVVRTDTAVELDQQYQP